MREIGVSGNPQTPREDDDLSSVWRGALSLPALHVAGTDPILDGMGSFPI